MPSAPKTRIPQSPALDLGVNQIQMELLHTYSTFTCYTLTRNPITQTIWRVQVPKVAFAADYVMHSILSLASLHTAYSRPLQGQRYIAYPVQFHEAALRTASTILPTITDDNCVSLYTFSALSCFIAYAKTPKPKDLFLINGNGDRPS